LLREFISREADKERGGVEVMPQCVNADSVTIEDDDDTEAELDIKQHM